MKDFLPKGLFPSKEDLTKFSQAVADMANLMTYRDKMFERLEEFSERYKKLCDYRDPSPSLFPFKSTDSFIIKVNKASDQFMVVKSLIDKITKHFAGLNEYSKTMTEILMHKRKGDDVMLLLNEMEMHLKALEGKPSEIDSAIDALMRLTQDAENEIKRAVN